MPDLSQSIWIELKGVQRLCSVICTSYNREKYILQTLNSVYKQTYRPIELIVVEDGSIDNTYELLCEWGETIKSDAEFKFILVKQENTGAPKARNRALNLSKGEFIQEVGSDDLLHPLKLGLSIELLNKYRDSQSVWAPLKHFTNDEEETIFDSENYEEIGNHKATVTENLFEPQFMPSAGLHRRIAFLNAGPWNENLKRWQDLEYQVKIMKAINNYIVLDQPMYFFRQHNDGRINDLYKTKQGVESGLISLKATEKHLPKSAINNKGVQKAMKEMYLSLFFTGLNSKHYSNLNELLVSAIRWTSNRKSKLKLMFIKIALTILPKSLISKFLSLTKYGK